MTDAGAKRIGVLGMVVTGFFWVHGGIYGNEALLSAAPPAYLFVMLLFVPFVYSLPIALIVAELSTAWPEDGGYVVWVGQACGRLVGLHHAGWVWMIYAADAAIYPVLVAHYVDSGNALGSLGHRAVATFVIGVVTLINMNGMDAMVRFSTVLTVVSLAPTIAFTVLGLPKLRLEPLVQTQGTEFDWSLCVSWVLWLYCGFFSLGSLAGDLIEPRRTFLIALGVLFPAVLLLNSVPLAVSLSIDPDPSNYEAGHFNVVAEQLAGAWLSWGFQVGAIVCLVGLYNAAIITAERSLLWVVEQLVSRNELSSYLARLNERPSAGARALRWLLTNRTGIAPVYQLVNAVLASMLVWLPYEYLVEFSMLLSVPSICLFMYSFAHLRFLHPSRPRPFTVPGGNRVAVGITIIPVAVSLLYACIVLYAAVTEPHTDDGRAAFNQISSTAIIIGGGALLHFACRTGRAGPDSRRQYTAHLESELHDMPPVGEPGGVPPAAEGGDSPSPRRLEWRWLGESEPSPTAQRQQGAGRRCMPFVRWRRLKREGSGALKASPLLDSVFLRGAAGGGAHEYSAAGGGVEPLSAPPSPLPTSAGAHETTQQQFGTAREDAPAAATPGAEDDAQSSASTTGGWQQPLEGSGETAAGSVAVAGPDAAPTAAAIVVAAAPAVAAAANDGDSPAAAS